MHHYNILRHKGRQRSENQNLFCSIFQFPQKHIDECRRRYLTNRTLLSRLTQYVVNSLLRLILKALVKRWPTDLPGLGFEPLSRRILNRKRVSIAHNLSLSSAHCHYVTEVLLKRTYNRKSSFIPIKASPDNIRASAAL